MEELIEIIKMTIQYTALCWVVFSWLSFILNFVMNKINVNLAFLLCPKCMAFWITLAITFNPFIAAIVAFNNYIIDKYITNSDIKL